MGKDEVLGLEQIYADGADIDHLHGAEPSAVQVERIRPEQVGPDGNDDLRQRDKHGEAANEDAEHRRSERVPHRQGPEDQCQPENGEEHVLDSEVLDDLILSGHRGRLEEGLNEQLQLEQALDQQPKNSQQDAELQHPYPKAGLIQGKLHESDQACPDILGLLLWQKNSRILATPESETARRPSATPSWPRRPPCSVRATGFRPFPTHRAYFVCRSTGAQRPGGQRGACWPEIIDHVEDAPD